MVLAKPGLCVGEGNLLGEHGWKGNKYRDRVVVRGGCGSMKF